MPLKITFAPISSPVTQIITLAADPWEKNAGGSAGWTTDRTFTFTPSDLKNNRYEAKEIFVSFGFINNTSAAGQVRITAGGVVQTAYDVSNLSSGSYQWNIPITDYATGLTILIERNINGAHTYNIKNILIEARVITRV